MGKTKTHQQNQAGWIQFALLAVGTVSMVATLVGAVGTWSPQTAEPILRPDVAMYLTPANGEAERRVEPNHTFRTGDCIRLHLTSQEPGHLYLIGRTYDGRANLLFPTHSAGSALSGQVTGVPKEGICFWQESPDTVEEHLVVVVSPQPLGFLEQLPAGNTLGAPTVPVDARLDALLQGMPPNNDRLFIQELRLRHVGL